MRNTAGAGRFLLALAWTTSGGACGGARPAEPITPTPSSARAPEPRPAVAPARPDARVAAFAAFLGEATDAVVAAATGQPHAERWNGPSDHGDLRGTHESERVWLRGLGGPLEPLLTVVEGSICSSDRPVPTRLKFLLVMRRGGAPMLAEVERVSAGDAPADLTEVAPELAAFAPALGTALGGARCEFAVVTPAAIADLPATVQADVLAESGEPFDLREACAAAAASTPPWTMSLPEDFVVIASAGGHPVELTSDMEADDGDFYLERVEPRELR